MAEDISVTEELTQACGLRDKDPVGAFRALSRLAEVSVPGAMIQLGWHYQQGCGVDKDVAKAEEWYWEAYSTGSDAVKAQATYLLAWLYRDSEDYKKALHALSLGTELNYAPAFYNLGRMYKDGLGVKKHPEWARALFEKAAAQGHLGAKRDLARMFLSGRFGPLSMLKGLILSYRVMKEYSSLIATHPDINPRDDRQIFELTKRHQ